MNIVDLNSSDVDHMRLSVVILTYNEKNETVRCVKSLVPYLDEKIDEIVVFDNGSVDGTQHEIMQNFSQVRYFRSENNLGVANGRNTAISMARGKFIMTLDNDTIFHGPEPGPIVESYFEQHKIVGVVGFKLLNADGTVQRSVRRFPPLLQPFIARIPLLRIIKFFREIQDKHLMLDIDLDAVNSPLDVDYVIGANQVFLRDLFIKLGGYDKKMFYGAEDCEFCLRVKQSGLMVHYVQTIHIFHLYKRRSRYSIALVLRHFYSFYYMYAKHKRFVKLFP